MKRLKIGQLGIAHNHGNGKMNAVRKFPELFEVVGYSEEDETWVERRGDFPEYRDLPRLSEDELIARSDVVLVECNVWDLTAKARKCIDAGKHVHIDKPASGTLAEYRRLLDVAKEKGLAVQLGYMYRYNFAINKLFRMIEDGELGEICQIDAEMSTYHSKEYREWLGNFKGGSMYIFGSHLIDLIMRILGEPRRVVPFIKQTGFEGVYSDDNCFAVLEYEKAVARITTLSTEVNGWGMRRFAVFGTLGTVEIMPIERDVKMKVSKNTSKELAYKDDHEYLEVSDVPQNERYDLMMRELYDVVTEKCENPYSYDYEYSLQKTLYDVIGGPQ